MNILVAIDSFKGSLSSGELGETVELGIKKVYPNAIINKVTIADGGEGTLETIINSKKGIYVDILVNNPIMKKIMTKYGIIDKNTAVIEMASASGLPLLKKEEQNPLKTTTFGTGEMIKDAIHKGCRNFIIGIGGSATNDGGIGMLQALGYKFYDKNGNELNGTGENLLKIDKIDYSKIIKELEECKFLVACDVDNPLYGIRGAAHVFAKQKGANNEMIEILDKGLINFSEIIKKDFGKDIASIKGSGAAGGLGGAFLAFFNSQLKSGIDIILDEIEFEKKLEGVDFVITGEGKIDNQSVMGKAPIGIAKLCKIKDIPVIAIGGCISDDANIVHEYGIDTLFSIINYPISMEKAMEKNQAKLFVEKNVEEIFRLIKICQNKYSLL